MSGSDSDSASFGPFKLFPTARTLEKDGAPVFLGTRALDILIVLVERAGEVVGHKELLSRVWRGLVVDPGNLRVHITGLRKALGEGRGKARYIANVLGQGYCFVAPVKREFTVSAPAPPRPQETPLEAARHRLALPPVLARMVGRDEAVRIISTDLIADRFVSIIGPGGMGKTTVAVSVAHAMLDNFSHGVCFVDISAVAEPKLVAATIASTLGLTVQGDELVSALLQYLRTLRVLLVLDNCEHVIDTVAVLAERIFEKAPGVHILATSREALRAEGEHAYWLPPLASPPADTTLTAADALAFPAVKLFVDRVAASGGRFELSDTDAPTVAHLCARLDGIALAIEIAAGRVGTYGLAATADLLNKHLGLHWPGRRTAPPRHQTLQALLDWSYSSLAEPERRMLRRLAIFVGTFTIAAAQAIADEGAPDESRAIDTVDGLVGKSLVSSVISGDGVTRFRLLETTRVYGLEKLSESGEIQGVARRHAQYFASLLNCVDRGAAPHRASGTSPLGEHQLGNIRAALEWCFNDSEKTRVTGAREPALAIDLTAGAAPILLELSLLSECQKWTTAALSLLDDTTRGSSREMALLEARAIASMWVFGNSDIARNAITKALQISRDAGETSRRLRLLVAMHVFLIRAGDVPSSLAVAEEFEAAVRNDMDTSYGVLSDWLLGSSHHFIGDQAQAQQHFEKGFACSEPLNVQVLGLDHRVRALVTFSRILWLRGSAERAQEIARQALSQATESNNPLNVCFSSLYTATLFLWSGDHSAARNALESLMTHSHWAALPSLHATAAALKGELHIRMGEAELGVTLLRPALTAMRTERQNLMVARAACALGEGLVVLGRHDEALSVIRYALGEAGNSAEGPEFAEMLRIEAIIHLSMHAADESAAEECLIRALDVARRQGALAWELRASMTLARLRASAGRTDDARQLVSSCYARFSEGLGTADLQAAQQFLWGLEKTHTDRNDDGRRFA